MIQNMFVVVTAALHDRKGVSSLEYAILAFGIISAVTAALTGFGTGLSGIFSNILKELT